MLREGNHNEVIIEDRVTDDSRSVAFYTLGCKLNFAETSTIFRQFQKAGYRFKEFESGADIYVINTCSVTDHADRKCKQIVKSALKKNPLAQVIIIGCYAQLKPEEIIKIPGVNMVLGAAEKFNILNHIQNLDNGCEPSIFNTPIKETANFFPSFSVGDRTRSFLKVQDGCDYFCAFCTIPLARGRSRSSGIEEIYKSAQEIASNGVKEIVLTGVNIGDFKTQNGERFLDLIKVLDEVKGIHRFRISSIEPNLLSNEIIEFVSKSKSFVPHFHIPLQSGSDRILELMRRRYKSDLYKERVTEIKKLMPHACIGVDIIVGFPSETEADFMETYEFLMELDVSYFHVFPYSERPDTTAIRIKGRVPERVRNERLERLRILSEKKKAVFYNSQVGKTLEVLWEAGNKGENLHGFTPNYTKVSRAYDSNRINQLEKIVVSEESLVY